MAKSKNAKKVKVYDLSMEVKALIDQQKVLQEKIVKLQTKMVILEKEIDNG